MSYPWGKPATQALERELKSPRTGDHDFTVRYLMQHFFKGRKTTKVLGLVAVLGVKYSVEI